MKKIFCICLCIIFVVSLCACVSTVKEASSETEARRILITAFSDLTDISKQLEIEYIKSSDLKKVGTRIENCLADIHSTDLYKDLDTISEKYNSALNLYNKVKKQYDKKYKEIIEYEKTMNK